MKFWHTSGEQAIKDKALECLSGAVCPFMDVAFKKCNLGGACSWHHVGGRILPHSLLKDAGGVPYCQETAAGRTALLNNIHDWVLAHPWGKDPMNKKRKGK